MIITGDQITTKSKMYERLYNGAFGNTTEQWFDLKSFLKNGPHKGLFGIRSLIAGGRCDYNVPAEEVESKCKDWQGGFSISPMQPDRAIELQGEVCRSPDLQLFYSKAKLPMRKALALNGKSVSGLTAKMILEHYLDPSSYNDVMDLLELYPGHVVEFSTYRVGVGINKNRNTVIWECRLY